MDSRRNSETQIEILEAGIYEVAPKDGPRDPRATKGYFRPTFVVLTKRTNQIPLRRGVIFGLTVCVTAPPGAARLDAIVRLPKPGLVDQKTGTAKTEILAEPSHVQGVFAITCRFAGESLLPPGDWVFEFRTYASGGRANEVRKLCEHLLSVVADEASNSGKEPLSEPAEALRGRFPSELASFGEGRTDKDFSDLQKWVQRDAAALPREEKFSTLVGSGWPAPLVDWFLDEMPGPPAPSPPRTETVPTALGLALPSVPIPELSDEPLPWELFTLAAVAISAVGVSVLLVIVLSMLWPGFPRLL